MHVEIVLNSSVKNMINTTNIKCNVCKYVYDTRMMIGYMYEMKLLKEIREIISNINSISNGTLQITYSCIYVCCCYWCFCCCYYDTKYSLNSFETCCRGSSFFLPFETMLWSALQCRGNGTYVLRYNYWICYLSSN